MIEELIVSDLTRAMSEGARLVRQADTMNSGLVRIRSRRVLAQALAYAGRFEPALDLCNEAIEIGLATREDVETARVRLASLHALASLGRFDEAIAAGVIARTALHAAGELELTARADLNLGAVHAMNDDPKSALVYFDRAKPAFSEQSAILAQLETNRGNALAALDNYSEADDAFNSAVASFDLAGQTIAAAIAEGNLGYLAARRGLIQLAMHHFESARRKLESSEADTHRARLLAEQADVIATLGLPVEAVDALEALIPELDRFSLVIEAARARIALCRAYIMLDRFDAASEPLTAAMSAFAELGQPIDLARAQLVTAGLALHRGDLESARNLVAQAQRGLSDRPADAAAADITAARVFLASCDVDAADQSVENALRLAQQFELAPVEAEAHLLKGRVQRIRGASSIGEFLAAVELTEQIRGTLQAGPFRSAFQSDRIAPYVELLADAIEETVEKYNSTAFRASELIKSRGLLDLVDMNAPGNLLRSATPSPPENDLDRRLISVREELNWRYSSLTHASIDDRTHVSLRDLEREAQQLETQRSATARPGSPGLAPVELTEALSQLPSGTVAVSYSLVHNELIALILREGKCTIHRGLSDLGTLNTALRRLRLQISRALSMKQRGAAESRLIADARRELQQLWAVLIQPIEQELAAASKIVFVPAGPVHMVPIGALWNGSSHLIERAEVSVVPSLSIYTRLGSYGGGGSRDPFLLVGIADDDAPHIAQEIEAISAATETCQVLLNTDATADRVKMSMLGAATMHFACHGRFSREFPNASGLKLSDRWLTLAEIIQMDLRGAHLTLSACDTGRASLHAVEELVGLSQGLYAAGIRSMITSLWTIDDDQTVQLMSDCYLHRKTGASFAAALRKAQLNALKSGIHPAFWAPFTFGGRA